MISLERSRAERYGRRFVAMVLESKPSSHFPDLLKLIEALKHCTRDTDLTGWYHENTALGVLYTEVADSGSLVVEVLAAKARKALIETLGSEASAVELSFHVFPDDFDGRNPGRKAFSVMYPDLARDTDPARPSLIAKRCIDVFGSLALLFLLAPVFFLIACAIKCTSKGPVLFRQKRLGQFGEAFTFLKFRSMYVKNDQSVHEAYVKRFIRHNDAAHTDSDVGTYKIRNDPRVTKIGSFLRRTSLDELPQLLHVLTGRMSLVGPRPPVQYEFSAYETWHKRRLLVKPGITGYWQVEGRSRVKFDEMVRMDIRYSRDWSLRLDLWILLRTPRAVLSGNGAC